eukprot:Pompholyxophrys_punicea_v1_NODE_232_length_2639_cov_3.833204.p2 type:complete len:102 gc:universal NODE_232_length_2639_cov_3.833204:123-428(+)
MCFGNIKDHQRKPKIENSKSERWKWKIRWNRFHWTMRKFHTGKAKLRCWHSFCGSRIHIAVFVWQRIDIRGWKFLIQRWQRVQTNWLSKCFHRSYYRVRIA